MRVVEHFEDVNHAIYSIVHWNVTISYNFVHLATGLCVPCKCIIIEEGGRMEGQTFNWISVYLLD
jgi:hypothetical protein